MKKILGALLCLSTLLTVGNAEVFTEKNKEIKYSLTLDKPVNVELSFKFNELKELVNGKPYISIYDDKARNKGAYNFLTYYLNTNIKDISKVNIPLVAGNYKIYLRGDHYLNKNFDFGLTKISGNFEQEPNNEFSNATLMNEKSFYSGYLQTRSGTDRDFYKINMKQDGVLDLVFKTNNKCKKGYGGYVVSFHNGSINKLNDRENNYMMRAYNTFEGFRKTIGLKKGEYFVKIRSNTDCLYNKKYTFAYLESPTKYTELEPNNDYNTATKIENFGYYYQGRMQTNTTEYDYYTFELLKEKEIIISLKQPNFEILEKTKKRPKKNQKALANFTIKIYDNTKKHDRLTYFSTKTDKVTQHKVKLSKGKYYIRVKGQFNTNKIKNKKYLEYGIAIIE